MIRFGISWALGLLALALAHAGPLQAADKSITVASTTSTQNSGLFGAILPKFTAKTGIQVRIVAVGTGQAISLARRGDADVLFVHHPPSERKFVAGGFGVKRYPVMYNDFVLVGPKADPAGIKGGRDVVRALGKIAKQKAIFVSRGDNSGTQKKERGLWQAAGLDPSKHSGKWYREIGSGMGATLNTATAMGAYTLTDRGSWIAFKNKSSQVLLLEGDRRLFNPYGVILVNPKRHAHVQAKWGQKFIDWVISAEGQREIGNYKLGGKQLFFPNGDQ